MAANDKSLARFTSVLGLAGGGALEAPESKFSSTRKLFGRGASELCRERFAALRPCRAEAESCCDWENEREAGWWTGGDEEADLEMGVMNRKADNAEGGRTGGRKETESAACPEEIPMQVGQLTTEASLAPLVRFSHAC